MEEKFRSDTANDVTNDGSSVQLFEGPVLQPRQSVNNALKSWNQKLPTIITCRTEIMYAVNLCILPSFRCLCPKSSNFLFILFARFVYIHL